MRVDNVAQGDPIDAGFLRFDQLIEQPREEHKHAVGGDVGAELEEAHEDRFVEVGSLEKRRCLVPDQLQYGFDSFGVIARGLNLGFAECQLDLQGRFCVTAVEAMYPLDSFRCSLDVALIKVEFGAFGELEQRESADETWKSADNEEQSPRTVHNVENGDGEGPALIDDDVRQSGKQWTTDRVYEGGRHDGSRSIALVVELPEVRVD